MLSFGLCGHDAFAQIGAPQAQTPTSQANQLPLSGRTGPAGGVTATQSAIPGTTTSVNTLNPVIQVQGAYSGSAGSTNHIPFTGKLSLPEAIQRGIQYNLGAIGVTEAMRQAHGQMRTARSSLLPNIRGSATDTLETVDLQAVGIRFSAPGFVIPVVVGPFEYMDFRAHLTQTLADFTALNNYRAAKQTLQADQLSAKDAQDLVVLAVGGAYLQAIAAGARVESARSQLETANAVYEQTLQQFQFGKVPQIDVNRSHVEVLTDQQRLVSLQNDVAKQKINLARMTGLPPNETYDLSSTVPYAPAPAITIEAALKQAFEQRADLKAADTQVHAAERTLAAARAERLPSFSVSGDYGYIGPNPGEAQRTYTATASLNVPIWTGGRTAGDIEEAEATLAQRRAELEDLRSQIERDVRNAYLDLQAATTQVQVAQQNQQLIQETLEQTRERLAAGVSSNVELVQSQESVASAQLDYINSVFAHNVAKLSLARAMGDTADHLAQFLSIQ